MPGQRARGGSAPQSNTRLAYWRLRRGVTQEDLARAVGMTVKAYRKLERGDPNPGLNHMLNVAMALRVRLVDILEEHHREWVAFDARRPAPPDPDELWGEDAERSHITPADQAAHL